MKTKILMFLSALVVSLGFSSCGDDWSPEGSNSSKKGELSLASLSVDVKHVETEVSRASVDVSNFIVKIFKADGQLAQQYRYSQMPEIITLPVGEYSVKVYSHEIAKAEWERPYYEGEKTFSITENNITEVGVIVCKFASLKVSIRYTEKLRQYLGDDTRVTVIANDEGSLEFTLNETRSGYYEVVAGSTTLVATLKGTIKGVYTELPQTFTDVNPGQHRIITYDARIPNPAIPDEHGTIDPATGIMIEVSYTDVDITGGVNNEEGNIAGPSDRPGIEEPENPDPNDPDPNDPNTDPNPGTNPVNITAESATLVFWTAANPVYSSLDASPAAVSVTCQEGVAHFVVAIDSTDPNFVQAVGEVLSTEFDLCYPIARDYYGAEVDLTDALRDDFGFPVRNDVIGKTAMTLDISAFVPLLSGFPGVHTFTLTITDSKGAQLVKVLKFKVD